jgi:hypothetical protein
VLKKFLIAVLFVFPIYLVAQNVDSFKLTAVNSNSYFTPPNNVLSEIHKGRTIGVSSGIGTVWAGSMIGLHSIWYKGVEKSSWHTFDDSREWLQMDKAGHLYTANKISNLTGELYQWAGWKNSSAALMGFGVGMGYLFTLESLDATGKDWGFSWSDIGANTLGSGLYLAQQLGWKEQRLILKFSYTHSPYAQYRPNTLGATFPERLLKDYNGQTYWLSVSPGTFMKNSRFPKWLCFSVGYGIDGKLHGHDNVYTIEYNGENLTFNAKRQLLFSLDIDFSRIPIKQRWLKAIVKQFNYIKLPFPTIILTGNQWGGRWLYF